VHDDYAVRPKAVKRIDDVLIDLPSLMEPVDEDEVEFLNIHGEELIARHPEGATVIRVDPDSLRTLHLCKTVICAASDLEIALDPTPLNYSVQKLKSRRSFPVCHLTLLDKSDDLARYPLEEVMVCERFEAELRGGDGTRCKASDVLTVIEESLL
jgi:hypothetical protein